MNMCPNNKVSEVESMIKIVKEAPEKVKNEEGYMKREARFVGM